jgi:hypothetical protein
MKEVAREALRVLTDRPEDKSLPPHREGGRSKGRGRTTRLPLP